MVEETSPTLNAVVVWCDVQFKEEGKEVHGFHPVEVLLSYLAKLKAPLVPDGTPVVNALAKQRAMLENTFRACIGLAPENNMMLEFNASAMLYAHQSILDVSLYPVC